MNSRGVGDALSPEADAVEQAAELADRFRRAYHASIRALRDWRRYPVVIQNAEQVNIAADGGQQVNVKQGKKRKSSNKGKPNKPKQLGMKEESIRMKTASDAVQVKWSQTTDPLKWVAIVPELTRELPATCGHVQTTERLTAPKQGANW
jgi:hypothetical protein